MVAGMNALLDLDPTTSEQRRRGMLAEADELLGAVEELRLQDANVLPDPLAEAVKALQLRLGRTEGVRPGSLRAAHNLVLAAQHRLMASNPRNPVPQAHPGRGMGQPLMTLLREGRWKFLTIPSAAGCAGRDEWLELVDDTVERACDRWAYAHHQVVRAAREGRPARVLRAVEEAAWSNYFDLRSEAERLRSARSS